ncbi:hypothetical protein LPJ70_000266 [Coemansia sp. RSA 2708]|nr:hypothetical protein LPJ70_000266 [Coemansia sp. RSA 2708]
MARTCYYELLGVKRSAGDADLKKAYRRLALVWHPDKNHGNTEEATRVFAEIKEAYETLSDPQERAWYDNHREQILRGDDYVAAGTNQQPDMSANVSFTSTATLMRFFGVSSFRGFDDSAGGFFAVYRGLFAQLRDEELQVSGAAAEDDFLLNLDFGDSYKLYDEDEAYAQGRSRGRGTGSTLRDFYNFWTTFTTRKSFGWFDRYRLTDAENRQVRRLMEKENRHLRDKARREFVETVQSLAAWMRKRDPRYKSYTEQKQRQQQERDEERRRRLAEQRAAAAADASAYVPQAWEEVDYTRILKEQLDLSSDEADTGTESPAQSQTPADDSDLGVGDELACVICDKAFKTAAQKDNHEKSKKHMKAVREARREMLREERQMAKMQQQKKPAADDLESGDDAAQLSDSVVEEDDLVQIIQELEIAQAETGKKTKRKKRQQQQPQPEVLPPAPGHEAVLVSDYEAEQEPTPDSETPARRPTKREQRRERQKAKAQNELACNVCNKEFASRNQLFNHIGDTGHALAAKTFKGKSVRR